MSTLFHAVGLGPGDPQLLTLRARSLIERADVLAWPVGSDGTSRARSIIKAWIHERHIALPCPLPIDSSPISPLPIKSENRHRAYDEIARNIHAHYVKERRIVFCCLGDPMFYASFAALLPHLQKRNIHLSIVPGITSIHAGAAAAQIPLCADNDCFRIIPGTTTDDVIRRHLEDGSPGVIMKPGRHFPRIRQLLETMGRVQDAFYLEQIGSQEEKILPLAQKTGAQAPYFSLILIQASNRAS